MAATCSRLRSITRAQIIYTWWASSLFTDGLYCLLLGIVVKMTGRTAVLAFLALCLCHSSIAKDHVPVLIWNTNQAQGGVPAVSALQYINYANFQAKYLTAFTPNNILLFLQDALSIEDLTSHTSELHHIKKWMESGHSLFLPNVEDAAHLVHDLPSHGYNVLKLDHDAGLNLKQEDKNLVVVELPSTLTNPSRRRALQKADEVMENVISKIGGQRDFTIIFTGKKPSVDERSDQYAERIRVARSLKAVGEEPDILGYHSTDLVQLYLRQNLTLNLYSDGKLAETVIIPETSALGDTGDLSGDYCKMQSTYSTIAIGSKTFTKLLLTYVFAKERGPSWVLDSATISLDTNVKDAQFNMTTVMDQVPVGMSFACSKKFVLASNAAFLTYDKAELVIEGFQMEAFQPVLQTRFDSAWDCVGFFTVPIWCGLLVTLILVIILTMGMFMLSDIKTMDRFDDPKGQPISVPTAE